MRKVKTDRNEYTLNQYEKIETLGKGTGGTVYKVRDPKGDMFALKQIEIMRKKDGTIDKIFHENVKREIHIMKRSSHPCICKVYKFWITEPQEKKDSGSYWILMELSSCTLGDFIRNEPKENLNESEISRYNHCKYRFSIDVNVKMSEKIMRKLIYDILRALRYLKEEQNVAHFDLKPSNIIFGKNGNFKLIDFGISRIINDEKKGVYCPDGICTVTYRPYENLCVPPSSSSSSTKHFIGNFHTDIWSLFMIIMEICHPYIFKNIYNDIESIQQVKYLIENMLTFDDDITKMKDNQKKKETSFGFISMIMLNLMDDITLNRHNDDNNSSSSYSSYFNTNHKSVYVYTLKHCECFYDFIQGMYQLNPKKRKTARELLEHPYMSDFNYGPMADKWDIYKEFSNIVKNNNDDDDE